MNVEADSSFTWATYDIVNGTLSTTWGTEIDDVYNQMGAEVTSGIGFNDAYIGLDFVKQISNGTVKYGVKINSEGEVVVHIIVKEILRESGPVIYSQTYEIEMVFRGSDNSSPEAEPAFNLQEWFESAKVQEGVKTVVVGVLVIGVIAAIIYFAGGIEILASFIQLILQALREILTGLSYV